jgi:hypothetical protein
VSENREQKNQIFTKGTAQHVDVSPGIKKETTAERLQREFNINIPAEVVTLPSGGVVYTPESGLYLKRDIMIKPMTTREEDILTTRAFIKKGTVITELIKSCVAESGIDLDALIAGDRNALMIGIRCTGYGAIYKPTMDCPACGTATEQVFDLGKLAIKPLEVSPVADGVNEFAFELPKTKANVTFKFLTGKDEEELLTMQERKKKIIASQVDTLISDQLKATLLSVNTVRDRNKLAFFVDNMPGQDSLALREYMRTIQPGIDMTAQFECDKCNHNEEVQIPIGIEFFWPSSRG